MCFLLVLLLLVMLLVLLLVHPPMPGVSAAWLLEAAKAAQHLRKEYRLDFRGEYVGLGVEGLGIRAEGLDVRV